MDQLAINFSPPRAREAQAALDHADRVYVGWSDVAYKFLEQYARTHREIFTAETVTQEARKWGLSEPPTSRAWGGLYRRARHSGIILCVDNKAVRYNGSPAPRYRSLIYRAAA